MFLMIGGARKEGAGSNLGAVALTLTCGCTLCAVLSVFGSHLVGRGTGSTIDWPRRMRRQCWLGESRQASLRKGDRKIAMRESAPLVSGKMRILD
jgi:hypothetical protein